MRKASQWRPAQTAAHTAHGPATTVKLDVQQSITTSPRQGQGLWSLLAQESTNQTGNATDQIEAFITQQTLGAQLQPSNRNRSVSDVAGELLSMGGYQQGKPIGDDWVLAKPNLHDLRSCH